jgi:hypothetical protein
MSVAATRRPISESELDLLAQACRSVPEPTASYLEDDYITNVLYTVLDLQMHAVTVGNALRFYKANRWSELRTLADLEAVLARFPKRQGGQPPAGAVPVGQQLLEPRRVAPRPGPLAS